MTFFKYKIERSKLYEFRKNIFTHRFIILTTIPSTTTSIERCSCEIHARNTHKKSVLFYFVGWSRWRGIDRAIASWLDKVVVDRCCIQSMILEDSCFVNLVVGWIDHCTSQTKKVSKLHGLSFHFNPFPSLFHSSRQCSSSPFSYL